MTGNQVGRWIPAVADHLTGVNRARTTLHAVSFRNVIHQGKRLTCLSVCGRRVYMAGQPAVDSKGASLGGVLLTWPPYQRHEGKDRCGQCWAATGKPRPADCWKPNRTEAA